MKNKLIAVYGGMRKEGDIHYTIRDQDYIGTFDSEPIYDMYSLIIQPALIKNGSTSIKMEVYSVDTDTLALLRRRKRYDEDENTTYSKEVIKTPYGPATILTYNGKVTNRVKVVSGDWIKFKDKTKELINYQDVWD